MKAALVAIVLMLIGPPVGAREWHRECRDYSPAKTVRCIARKQRPPGGVSKALAVWRCESYFGVEPYHSDPYHGPFQYLTTTYASQRGSMPDMRRWFEISPNVHDWRSNIITAVGWAARHGWGPWTCG